MSIIGDFEHIVVGTVSASWDQSGSAPSPTVSSNSALLKPVEPASWTAPDASGSGQITVHRDALNSVATRMRSDVTDLDTAAGKIKGASGGWGSLTRWATGSGFSGNGTSGCDGFSQATTQLSDLHATMASNLADSASTYDQAESSSQQAVNNVGGTLDASSASVTSAGQI